tara:strand:- start:12 stop:245 length:234 start_codon:yes stop_codon:yes gene_type:complete
LYFIKKNLNKVKNTLSILYFYFNLDKEGLSNGYTKGIYEGAEETLKLVEKYSNTSDLKSTLDWETTQRSSKEQMGKN